MYKILMIIDILLITKLLYDNIMNILTYMKCICNRLYIYPEINSSHVGEAVTDTVSKIRSSIMILHHINMVVNVIITLEHVTIHL